MKDVNTVVESQHLCHDFCFVVFSSPAEPRWASVNRGVLICDECCSVHRSLGRHSSQVRHLTHTQWPPTQLQVITPNRKVVKNRFFTLPALSLVEGRIFRCWNAKRCQSQIIILERYTLLTKSCSPELTEMYWFLSKNRKCLSWGIINSESEIYSLNRLHTFYRSLFFISPTDGSDVIQQRSEFNMGALTSGPCVCDEWKTQGQPSGQITVRRFYLKIIAETLFSPNAPVEF